MSLHLFQADGQILYVICYGRTHSTEGGQEGTHTYVCVCLFLGRAPFFYLYLARAALCNCMNGWLIYFDLIFRRDLRVQSHF